MVHRSIAVLIAQILFFVFCSMGPHHGYLWDSKLKKTFKLTIFSIHSSAFILELIFIHKFNVCLAILFGSMLVATIVLHVMDSIGKRKYYALLKQRIQIIEKNCPAKNPKELQKILVEKYDVLYSIPDIQKVYNDF